MEFDHRAIRPGRARGAEKRRDPFATPRRGARIDDDRKMRAFLQDRDGGKIEGVTRCGLKGADAPSQRMTRAFPSLMMYSAAASHSSIDDIGRA